MDAPPPAPAATASLPAANESVRPDARNDVNAVENDSRRSKRTKRAERTKDRQNRTARVRSMPQDDDRNRYGARVRTDDRDASGTTARTYQMEGGGRVTVYQRGPTLQVGDRVEFGDSPRSRRRAERGFRDRDDDRSFSSRGSGEFFFDR